VVGVGRKVVISGVGLVGSTGNGDDAFWRSLLEGRSGIRRITRFDASAYPCQVGGEVADLSYEALIEPRKLRTTAHVTQLALASAELALRDTGSLPRWPDPTLVGVSLGTALGGWRDAAQQHIILLERGARRVNPFIANGTPNHAPGAEVAEAVGAQGEQSTFSTGCAASLQAVDHGAALIARGDLDYCLAGGAESPLTPTVISGMSRTQELSTLNEDPPRASRPFDQRHAGMVLSEGSCILLLEAAEQVARRGAIPNAEVLGAATSCDASGMYAFNSSGEPAARAIHRALGRSGLNATEIDYVCAHANSSPAFDRKETLVIRRAFGEWAARMPVSSIKGVLGHPLGASGAFQVAAAALAIRHQIIPPTHNLETPDAECTLGHVLNTPRSARVRRVLVTNYGYGGVNAYLVLAEPER
jgi:3-oxoacyl-[acyl-carrier-protein] synthase II